MGGDDCSSFDAKIFFKGRSEIGDLCQKMNGFMNPLLLSSLFGFHCAFWVLYIVDFVKLIKNI